MSDSRIEILDATNARHTSTWMVVMHTNQLTSRSQPVHQTTNSLKPM